jgi:hypothetical protein
MTTWGHESFQMFLYGDLMTAAGEGIADKRPPRRALDFQKTIKEPTRVLWQESILTKNKKRSRYHPTL